MPQTLTVGIPTYQRRDTVVATVAHLLTADLPPDLREIVVIDDGSSDGTFEALEALEPHSKLRVLRNETNRKFVGNFGRLFEEANTDYLLVTSDEDDITASHLAELIDLCTRSRPLLVSAQAMIDGSMFRGRAVERPIEAREWRSATNYISGTTYRVADSRPLLRPIVDLAADNGAAEVYPQVMLAAELLTRGLGMWFAQPLTVKARSDRQSHPGRQARDVLVRARPLEPVPGVRGAPRTSLDDERDC